MSQDAGAFLPPLRPFGSQRELLQKLVEVSPIAICVVEPTGCIVAANAKAEEVLGLDRATIVQRMYNDPRWRIRAYDGGPFPDEELPFQQVRRTGKAVYGVEHTVEWPDGRRVFLRINAAPLFDDAGKFAGVVAALEDCTEQVQAKRLGEALRDIAQAAVAAETLTELYEAVYRAIAGLIPAEMFYIALRRPGSDAVAIVYHTLAEMATRERVGWRGKTEYVLRTGRTLLADRKELERLAAAGEIQIELEGSPIYSYLGVLLVHGEQVIGVMAVYSCSPRISYGLQERQLLELLRAMWLWPSLGVGQCSFLRRGNASFKGFWIIFLAQRIAA